MRVLQAPIKTAVMAGCVLSAAAWISGDGPLIPAVLAGMASADQVQTDPDAAAQTVRLYSRAELEADLEAMVTGIAATHPDLSRTVAPEVLKAAVEALRAKLPDRATLRQTWSLLSTLNPVYNDGHAGVRYPSQAFQAHVDDGGKPFPLAVEVSEDGRLLVRNANTATSPQTAGIEPGTEILAINGQSAKDILADLLPRMRGEGESVRRFVLSLRFPAFYWSYYGPQEEYRLRLRHPSGLVRERVIAGRVVVEGNTPNPEDVFGFRLLNPQTGHLRADSFDIRLKEAFAAFLEETFTVIRREGVETLIIDLRNNGGGAHDTSDLLLSYLTGQRLRPVSEVVARVIQANRSMIPGAELGSVVRVPYPEWFEPEDTPLRFEGEVFILISPRSYSQAIAFAVTVQDYDIATIAGEETGGLANQSGQVTALPLPHTGLTAIAPLYILIRPNGERTGRGVIPDVDLSGAPDTLEALMEQL